MKFYSRIKFVFGKSEAPNTNKNLVKDITMPNSTKKLAKNTARHWTILIYPESVNPNFKDILCNPTMAFEWVLSPLHDKDLNDDGTPKKPHYHLLLVFDNAVRINIILEICRAINAPEYAQQVRGGITKFYEYLTHKNHPNKAQYSESDIECFNGFDIKEHMSLKELKKQDDLILNEIFDFVERNEIVSFRHLLAYSRKFKPEWFNLIKSQYVYFITQHIKSIAWEKLNGVGILNYSTLK